MGGGGGEASKLYKLQNFEIPLTASLLTTRLKKRAVGSSEIRGQDNYSENFFIGLLSYPFFRPPRNPTEKTIELICNFVHFSGGEKASLLTASMLSEVRTNVKQG